ncbi:MAG: methionyl-tRNA formyltransferase [Thermoanaerobaculia bacterium]|nr:methionyl-tRNA formyltransferase [Thermoanaerobaculia bacterium]
MIERTVFFGTPEFAVPALRALAASEFRPVLVVSQPSRPAKRGQRMTEPPVVVAARDLGIPFAQVEKVRDPAFLARLAELAPGVAVVVAFGQLFPRALLDLPRLGCINLHASLLPRWRGAAPIQAAIAAGDTVTGVTTMKMEEGLDSGPTLLTAELAIGRRETAGELSRRLADLGAPLLVETLRGVAAGTLVARSQDESRVTLAAKIRKEKARTRWDLEAETLVDLVRAFQPWPGAELPFGEEWVKVLQASSAAEHYGTAAGIVVAIEKERVLVSTGGDSVLAIERAQRAGRGPVSGGDLARGLHLGLGDRLI